MRFKIDENISQTAARILNSNNHDAETVFYEKISGISDKDLLETCVEENRCLITLDTDFADIKKYPPVNHKGVIILKVTTQGKTEVNSLLTRLLPYLESENIASKLWIVDKNNIIIRESRR